MLFFDGSPGNELPSYYLVVPAGHQNEEGKPSVSLASTGTQGNFERTSQPLHQEFLCLVSASTAPEPVFPLVFSRAGTPAANLVTNRLEGRT